MTAGWALEAHGLRKVLGDRVVLEAVDLRVARGEVHALLGRNGAGKTTTLRLAVGLLERDGGSLRLFGAEVPAHRAKPSTRVGALIETPGFYPNLSARDNLALFSRSRDRVESDALLSRVGLGSVGAQRVGRFSQGMKQRLGLARALLGRPELLVLDEPANGLDPEGIHDLRRLLREVADEGTAVLVSSHQLAEVELFADRVTILESGASFESDDWNAAGSAALELEVDDAVRAAALVRERWPSAVVDGREGGLRVRGLAGHAGALNRLLVEAGLEVTALRTARTTLEEHFFASTLPRGPHA